MSWANDFFENSILLSENLRVFLHVSSNLKEDSEFEKERIYTVEILNSGIPSEVTYFTFTFISQCCL